jgi:hypothetical protein
VIVLIFLPQLSCAPFPLAPADPVADNLRLSIAEGPLSDGAYKADLSLAYKAPTKMSPGQITSIHLLVRNMSQFVWPYIGQTDGRYQIRVGNRWLNQHGRIIEDGRGGLPYDLSPGGVAEVLLVITAPAVPGAYTVDVDLVQEQVAWFSEKGSEKLRFSILVE